MANMKLIIADKNYCLWPLPAWLCLSTAGFEFDEILIKFNDPNRRKKMLDYGPTGRVPVLHHNELVVWDSLAICEYVADLSPQSRLWPTEVKKRAVARAFAAEMHGTGGAYPGAMRHIIFSLDTNVRRRTPPISPLPNVQESIDYLFSVWRALRKKYGAGGDFLFGHFTIADAMSAHLVNRLVTYSIIIPEDLKLYVKSIREFPPMLKWIEQAEAEDWVLKSAEIDVNDIIKG
tara:strand:- start:114 stop:812 length:699 start_codon:yes stop_codon:yes gene_type:complete